MLLTKITTGLKLAILLAMVSFVYFASPVQAQIPSGLELNGHAWSSNIGWISLNCRTGGVSGEDICGTSDYKVSINSANRRLNGYAWSPNIGWIKFNALSGYPTGSGTTADSARLGSTNYANTTITGWARACAGSTNGDCTAMGTSTVSGGWDGWISMRGTSPDYGINTANFGTAQYVWGGDVVGWIDMSTNITWYLLTSVSGTGCEIAIGQSTCDGALTWSIPASYTNPSIVGTAPAGQTFTSTSRTGTGATVAMRYGVNTFEARSNSTVLASTNLSSTCVASSTYNGTTCESTVVAPTISLTPNQRLVRRGSPVILTAVSNPDSACTITGGGVVTNITATSGGTDHTTGPINNQTRFTLNCSGVTAVAVVDVLPTVDEI